MNRISKRPGKKWKLEYEYLGQDEKWEEEKWQYQNREDEAFGHPVRCTSQNHGITAMEQNFSCFPNISFPFFLE